MEEYFPLDGGKDFSLGKIFIFFIEYCKQSIPGSHGTLGMAIGFSEGTDRSRQQNPVEHKAYNLCGSERSVGNIVPGEKENEENNGCGQKTYGWCKSGLLLQIEGRNVIQFIIALPESTRFKMLTAE